MMAGQTLSKGDQVNHPDFGVGNVISDNGATVVVRFQRSIEECEKTELSAVEGILERIQRPTWDNPLEVVNRLQAECIASVNDTWGVFSLSRIQLLPHQLWVCRKVNANWPARWLVADDVGLGKTIEAGMILWPLLARHAVNRLLILCPAKLVDQWHYRLRTMFDIRLAKYLTELDTEKSGFWESHDHVVASMDTLRMDSRGRMNRLTCAEPWDLVIVDEAHHLNSDEHAGHTLAYKLVKQLQDKNLMRSMLFFTGTPHRGKDFGFFSLLSLLRPDLFDPRKAAAEQMKHLSEVMIRNNKSNVTDLKGTKLFSETLVKPYTYTYCAEESEFYCLLTEFITTGRAYASGLGGSEGRAVIMVLIAMQKLASSSVAAIHKALRGRRERIRMSEKQLADLEKQLQDIRESEVVGDADETARLEEEIITLSSNLQLMHDESPFLDRLISSAAKIQNETKVRTIISTIGTHYAERQVLLFTEYKATQSLLMSALMQQFGSGCVAFINGDERADGVVFPDGSVRTVSLSRENAAESFNKGDVRFLISTEAGGEGIDLQERCHTLIHVDLPWNPMRLHQRVGRLNRYGQAHRVEVISFRNPDTVESLIWDKLNEKIERINRALRQVMDEPEDLMQLVLGMTSPSLFNEVFSQGVTVKSESLSNWFDDKTATFGGEDAVSIVKEITGNVSKYDYQDVSSLLPRVDLPDLRPFLQNALELNGQRMKGDDAVEFRTPDEWRKDDPLIKNDYSGMTFDRLDKARKLSTEVLGVGHRVMNKALDQARARDATLTVMPKNSLTSPIAIFRIRDRVTTGSNTGRTLTVGIECDSNGSDGSVLLDWQLLLRLNGLQKSRQVRQQPPGSADDADRITDLIASAKHLLNNGMADLGHGFRFPEYELLALLWAESESAGGA